MATAVDGTVHVQDIEATATSKEVYTTDKVDNLLKEYGKKEDVQTNKDDIAALQTTTMGQGKQITANTTQIANNKDAIDKKIDMVTANATYATKDALRDLEDTVGDKADEAAVTTLEGRVEGVEGKVTTLENTVGNDSRGLVKDVNDLRTQGTTLNNALGNKADKTDLEDAINRITTNETNITALQKKTTGLTDDGKSLNGMNSVETDALTVKGEISNGAGVTTTLEKIAASMDRTDMNKTLIGKLNAKTTNITHDANGTSVDGVTFNAGAVTGVTSINGTKIGMQESGKYISQDGSIWGNMKKVDTQVETNEKNIETNKTAITNLDAGLQKEVADREAADAEINKKIGSIDNNQTEYVKEEQTISQNLTKLDNKLKDTNDRTGGITRNDAESKTIIERNVTVDSNGNVTAEGKLKAGSVDAGAITTTGAVNAGSLTVTDASTFKGDVTMNQKLNVTGDTTLNNTDVGGALNVTGASDLKGNVTLGTPNGTNTVTVNGTANFYAAAKMNNDLTVTGDTNLGNTTVDGNLKVTGTITTDKMVFGDKAHNNYTEIDQGKVTSKNSDINGAGQSITSSSTFDAEKNEVGFANNTTGDHSHHKQTADSINGYVTDKAGNKTYTKVTATENSFQVQDKDGKNKNHQVNTKDLSVTEITNGDGKTTKMEQTATDIINTAKDGTIKNEANHIENTATTMKTTVTGQATEEFNGGLDTNVTGTENHTVTGDQNIHVTKNQTNKIDGNQENTIGGSQTTTVTGKVTENYNGGQETNVTGNQVINVSGTQTTTATDIKRNASSGMIDTIDNDYGTNTETKVAGKTTTDVSIKGTGEKGKYIRGANESRDYLIKGTLKNSETKTVDATSTEITDGKGKTSATIQDKTQISGSVTNGTSSAVSNVKADSIDTAVKEGTNTSLISQKKDSITSAVGNGTTSTVIQQGDKDITIASNGGTVGIVGKDIINNATNEITNTAGTKITDKVGNNTRVIDQTSITDTVGTASRKIEDGKITDTAGDSTVTMENGKGTTFAKVGSAAYSTEAGATKDTNIAGNHITTGRVDANELGVSDKDDQGNTADLSVKAGEGIKSSATDKDGNTTYTKVTATENSFQVQDKDGKNKNHQVNTKGSSVTEITDKDGNTTKTEQTATDITNEASNSITDKVGTNTRVLNKDGITDTVGGSTFKQRIDAIMMESKNVSIKAEETLTNEAKVITNKASEVINNEAVNINNTATGIITSKASEIKNQADKLISNKVGENTWENMENGKITTSIKDGTKQNLTQSDAAGTTQSTVEGDKSTVTIQNADGLTHAVNNGTSINASATTATSSAQTILSGGKANSVITTIDGTQFVNSEAAAPVTGASGANPGTADRTTIKGNTITTGKVTMDYADVMKDLGVRGNANITGKTTTGSLEVTGTSTLKGDVTMGSNATVKKDLKVEGTTTTKTLNVTENATVGGTLDVTQKATFHDVVDITKDLSVGGNATIKGDVTAKSYKVGDKTYISADGINANDQKITNVADGSISEGSKDAVNGGQLYTVKNDLEGKVNKVGANAAAMANLHPMEFDPDSKWNIAAAIGNYGSETAAALGAFYRPNDDVMVNLSTAFGTGENMVGGGVSVRLGKGGNKLSREESNALKDQVNDLTARMDALLSVLNPNMSKDFPDVPENHWAYEAVSRLAGNDIVQGYPDGEFHGERTMTRYEMAEIIYNALSRGAEAEKELVEEFKPELQAMAASEKATAERAEG